ncbi:hypothetical protein [Mycobacteroides abscessus]|uniref:hypothetical protein n=1 Tax=Mycobacteroides abscessus TaxID=36809 RepID=UPI000C2624FF|nr:hypothetical protein [Mycobacteroides abscessus]
MTNDDLAAAMDRLRHLVIRSYTRHMVTKGGIVQPKTASQVQMELTVARELVAFSVNHRVVQGYMAPEGLWSALVDEAIERGDLVKRGGNGPLEHRFDYQLDKDSRKVAG